MRFSQLLDRPIITLAGQIDEGMIQVLDRSLKEIWANPGLEKRANLLLTTFGGSSGYALGMFERLRLVQRDFDLTIVATGIVFSHGVTIMSALPREKRLVTRGTRLYVHEMQKEVALTFTGPQNSRKQVLDQEVRTFAEEQLIMGWVVKSLADGSGQTEAKIREWMAAGAYFGGAEAVELGFCGALVDED